MVNNLIYANVTLTTINSVILLVLLMNIIEIHAK